MDARNEQRSKKIVNAFDWKNWECPVNGKLNWSTQNLMHGVSKKVTEKLETARMENRDYGTLKGISSKDRVSLLPKKFHIYQKAVPKGVTK